MSIPRNKPLLIFTAVAGAVWAVALVDWMWMYGALSGNLVTQFLPHVGFACGAVAAALWVWLVRDEPTLRRYAVWTVCYLPIWSFLVWTTDWLVWDALRAQIARAGLIGYFVVGLAWAVWGVEMASRRYVRALRSASSPEPTASSSRGHSSERGTRRVKQILGLSGAFMLVAGAFLPFLAFQVDTGGEISVNYWPFLGSFHEGWLVLGLGVLAGALAWFCLDKPLLFTAVAAVGLIVLSGVRFYVTLDADASRQSFQAAYTDEIRNLAALPSWGVPVLLLGGALCLASALTPRGELNWNPLDLSAWYYGERSQKLRQSVATFCAYSLSFSLVVVFLSALGGCSEIYEMPAGGGEQQRIAQQVKVQKVIRRKYVINPFSAIVFNPPPIDEIKLQLLELTKHAYQVGYGAGDGAGFSGGTKRGKVRFIRLEYAGGDWNQDFGVGADLNMLIEYGARTGHTVANRTEARQVAQLQNFPIGKSPPFVYMTGQKNISLSSSETKILREYLTDKHGMLFADNGGSRHWHNQFFSMMRKALPRVEPVRVPLDDPIHSLPYGIPFLPYVAPHGGRDAWGWKIDGRWVCYYHPGDIADAWSDDHAGVRPEIWEACYQLGTNVIFYAHVEYNKWLDARAKE